MAHKIGTPVDIRAAAAAAVHAAAIVRPKLGLMAPSQERSRVTMLSGEETKMTDWRMITKKALLSTMVMVKMALTMMTMTTIKKTRTRIRRTRMGRAQKTKKMTRTKKMARRGSCYTKEMVFPHQQGTKRCSETYSRALFATRQSYSSLT
jgi:hypothetical protein